MVKFPENWFIFGIGDFLRGSISAYEICRRLNIPFSVDYSDHPIGEFIRGDVAINRPPLCLMAHQGREFEQFLQNNQDNNDTITIYPNCNGQYPLSSECKSYMRLTLQPKPLLEEAIQKTLNHLGVEEGKYICISIRMGDNSFKESNSNASKYEHVAQKIIAMISALPNGHAQHVVVSDDKAMCKYFADRFNFKVRNTKPCHLGTVQFGDENIMDTLVDFFLLSRCATIVHYSVHHWISGFCHWTSNIYNIPIVAFTETAT